MGNTISTTPYGAQSNLVNVGLECTYGTTTDIFNATVAWTSPLTGNNIYYSGIEASISVPDSLSGSTASISLTINLDKSSPSDVVLSSTVQGGKTYKFKFDRQGPFEIETGAYSRATIGEVDIDFDSVSAKCKPTRAVISSVQGRDEANDFGDVAVGYPDTQPGQKAVVVNPRTRCTGADEFKIRLEAVLPAVPTGPFNITVKTFVTIPGNLVEAWTNVNRSLIGFQYNNAALGGYPGLQIVNPVDGLTKDWSKDFTSANVEELKPLVGFQYLNGVQKSEITLALPTQQTITVGEYSATNGIFSLWFISFSGLAAGYDANSAVNQEVGKSTFRCEAAFGDLFSVYSS